MAPLFLYLLMCGKIFVDVDYGKISFVMAVYLIRDYFCYLVIGELIIMGHDDIKDNISVGGTADHSEIVESDNGVGFLDNISDLCFHFCGFFIVNVNRVHMYGCKASGLLHDIVLDVIDGIVYCHKVSVGGDFGM